MTVKLYIATTLDGYIATEDDKIDWLFEVSGDGDNGYGNFMHTIRTVIMGMKTYDWLMNDESVIKNGWPYSEQDSYVFTRQNQSANTAVTFVNPDNIREFISTLAGDIWVVGGGEIIQLFLENGCVDEMQITIAPVLLGNGRRLFPSGNYAEKLKLIETKTYGQFVELHYLVTK